MEAKNIRINLYVTQTIWDILQTKENYSDYIRDLIDRDQEMKKNRGKNSKLTL